MVTIEDMRRINMEKGQYFFSQSTMRFFKSRIVTKGQLIKDKYFITSEKFDEDTPRLFTVRKFNSATGNINTVGEFQGFRTSSEAKRFAMNLE